jgi:hypothetical protein
VDNIYLHTVDELLKSYSPISLVEMDKVRLMDRVDNKFILSFNDLIPVIKGISHHYNILTINDIRIFSYRTDYYDTPNLDMFADHHNGKLNRYKIRQREYIESDIRFLEVKFKSNKGRTIKDRIEGEHNFSFKEFINKFTPYDPDLLKVSLVNRFNRLTLVDKNLHERVTIDLNLCFSDSDHLMGLNGLVIIEVKQNKNSRASCIYSLLKEKGIRPNSFSKYCLGIALLNRNNKFNNFKRTINLINKLSRIETNMIA